MTMTLLLYTDSKMSHTNHNIILYKLLKIFWWQYYYDYLLCCETDVYVY